MLDDKPIDGMIEVWEGVTETTGSETKSYLLELGDHVREDILCLVDQISHPVVTLHGFESEPTNKLVEWMPLNKLENLQ